MTEELTLHFVRAKYETFNLVGTSLREFAEDGKTTKVTDLPGDRSQRRNLFLDSDGRSAKVVRRVALAFVRVAQWNFGRLPDEPHDDIPVYDGEAGERFLGIREEAKRRKSGQGDSRNSKALDAAFLLQDGEGTLFLKKWFSVSTSPTGIRVSCLRSVLPPASVMVTVDGEAAGEEELDQIEGYLAFAAGAGIPPHLQLEGTTITGRPPSIQPGCFESRDLFAEAKRIYVNRQSSILCILGGMATGKTVFASYWLRHLIGARAMRQKTIFCWSFNRQGFASYVPIPLLAFFTELARSLGIEVGEKPSLASMTHRILTALAKQPIVLFLDGVEATFRRLESGGGSQAHDIHADLASLLKGILRYPDNFVLATSQQEFVTPFAMDRASVRHLSLEDDSPQPVESNEPSVQASPPQTKPKHLNTKRRRSAMAADTRRSLSRLWSCSEEELDARIAAKKAAMEPTGEYGILQAPESFDEESKGNLDILLYDLRRDPRIVLLHLLSACQGAIAEKILLSVAQARQVSELYALDNIPSAEGWDEVLNSLIGLDVLQEADNRETYELQGGKRRYISDWLKTRDQGKWIAINKAMGETFERLVTGRAQTRADIAPLVTAAVHFCEAGEKRHAYDIGYDRLSHGLKGYAIFHLGDYESARAINHALIGDGGHAAISGLPAEVPAMCMHANAICLRYSNRLEAARAEERKAWKLAQETKLPNAILPIGFNMLRLCHMFGDLHEAREVQNKIWSIVFKEIGNQLLAKVLKPFFNLREVLDDDDIVDGASALTSMLALTQVYRGKLWLAQNITLPSGIRQCRDKGRDCNFLMPSYGMPWHALALLEMGHWRKCEQAIESHDSQEWGSTMERYRQTGVFELLKAKTYLAKAQTLTAVRRKQALDTAGKAIGAALSLANEGSYQWWKTISTLTQGQIFSALGEIQKARQWVEQALDLSRQFSFKLLTVDALLDHTKLASTTKRESDRWRYLEEGLDMSKELGYALRVPAFEQLR